jgi:hypothetical protein
MFDKWREAIVAVAIAGTGAAVTVYTTTKSNEEQIKDIRADVAYLRTRVDVLVDRLPDQRPAR